MANKNTTAEALDRLATQYQAVIDAAAMLREIGSLEGAKDEAIKARAAAEKDLLAVRDEILVAKMELSKAKDKAKALLDEANNAADQKLAAANAAAEQIVATANLHVQQRIRDAEATAAGIKSGAQAELLQINNRISQLKDEAAAAASDLDQKMAAAQDAEKRLDQAKAKVKALID